jgi:uncharacterized phage protein gp47/JayE
MVVYIAPPFETDSDELVQQAYDLISTRFPNWMPHDGNLVSWVTQVLLNMVANGQDIASATALSIFRYFGQTVIGLQPVDAVAATTATTWTMQDDAGYTIPAGTQVAFATAGDNLVPFVTTDEVTVAPGNVSTPVGAVNIIAVDSGIANNNLGPAGLQLLDSLAYVTDLTAVSATGGGLDAESDETYIGRLIEYLQLMTPTPILAGDFALLARNIAGVTRATAIDNYNPADGTTDNERMVGVSLIDAAGQPVSAAIKTAVSDYLESLRETNFTINIFDPTYTAIDVDFTFTAFPGFDPALVQSAAVDAVTAYLSPGNWGTDPTDQSGATWNNETIVRLSEINALLNSVDGLRFVDTLTINGAVANVNLVGEVALPQPGVITGAPS